MNDWLTRLCKWGLQTGQKVWGDRPQFSQCRLGRLGGFKFLGLVALGVGLTLAIASCSASAPTSPSTAASSGAATVVRIGYQKSATVLNVLKQQGALDDRLKQDGVAVEWNEFVAGPQMLEALNVGSIDFAYTGETPPVFAQASGAPLVYVGYEPVGGKAEAILVRSDSPIQSVADLKGKKVALNKGSNVHYLLVRALQEAGLQYGDVESVYLPPGDARPAFEQGGVDAWVIWDPFMAAAEKSIGAKVLVDGTDLVANRSFYLSTRSFSEAHPEVLNTLLTELKTTSDWAKGNSADVTQFLSAELGIDKAAIELAEQRRNYGVLPITDEVVEGQQAIADAFFNLNLIPNEIKVADAIWQPN